MWSSSKYVVISLILVCALNGCGYTFSGMAPINLPQGKRHLCITKVVNPSTEAWLEPSLRSKLRDEFTRRGQVEWVNRTECETLVVIKILKYSESSTIKASDEKTIKSAIHLDLEVEMYDAAHHTLIWASKTVYANQTYRGEATLAEARSDAVSLAVERVADRLGQAF